MNFDQLSAALTDRKIDPSAYDIFGSDDHPSETYVIRRRMSGVFGKPDYWVTYYSERGLETGLRSFASEAEACQAFLKWVASDKASKLS